MNDLRHKFGRLAVIAAALALAGCSADELATEGGGSVAPPSGQTAASGTVNFTNNTSMTIGNGLDGLTRAAWLTRGTIFPENEACDIKMPEQPSQEEIDAVETRITDTVEYDEWMGLTEPIVIEKGGKLKISQDVTIRNSVYVLDGGTLEAEALGYGPIHVFSGGTLITKSCGTYGQVYAYEGSNVTWGEGDWSITSGGKIFIAGDLDIGDNVFFIQHEGTTLYVGGNLKCGKLSLVLGSPLLHVDGNVDCTSLEIKNSIYTDAENQFETKDKHAHIGGNLTVTPNINEAGNYEDDGTGIVTVSDEDNLCVEGVTTVYRLMASNGANVHTECKLVATDDRNTAINITNGATLYASYVETEGLHISGGTQGALTQVLLPDQGVINVDKLSLGNTMQLGLYKQGAKALVSAKTVTVENRVKWEDIVDPALYVNYDEIWADAEPADKSMINKVTMGASGECSPGFTVNEPEDPDPGTDPDDPEPEPEPTTGGEIEIPIKIDDIIDEDYILKADDFAIRVNGDYMADIEIEGGNSAKLDGVKIVNDALTIIINGLVDNPAVTEGNDYTYECWIWVENKSLLNDGTGGYGPLFDCNKYEDWANPKGDPDTEDPYGYDMTKRISESGKVKSPAGFVVRYNVYRGLAGRMDADGHGDTPYIKVSVSVQKDPDARENTNVGIWPAAYNN